MMAESLALGALVCGASLPESVGLLFLTVDNNSPTTVSFGFSLRLEVEDNRIR
jgi:hypothetical protein